MTGYNGFSYTLDAIGRPTALTETGPGTVWVQNAAYGPAGEMQTMQYRSSSGSYFTENRTYNNRVQLKEMASSLPGQSGIDLQYVYNPAGSNNGQVTQMNDVVSGEQVVYTYDSLKRLATAQTVGSGWGQSFGYDGWGNLLSKTPTSGHTGTAMSLSVDPSTNQPLPSSGFVYDQNGNATTIPSSLGNINLSYDVENRTGGTWFDQQNQPLDRTGVWNEYGLNGERLGTFSYSVAFSGCSPTGTGYLYCNANVTQTQLSRNIYFAGRLIQSNGMTVVTDRLGSVRLNDTGDRHEYYPYGEIAGPGASPADSGGKRRKKDGLKSFRSGAQAVKAASAFSNAGTDYSAPAIKALPE